MSPEARLLHPELDAGARRHPSWARKIDGVWTLELDGPPNSDDDLGASICVHTGVKRRGESPLAFKQRMLQAAKYMGAPVVIFGKRSR
jgi:hypothetical protein